MLEQMKIWSIQSQEFSCIMSEEKEKMAVNDVGNTTIIQSILDSLKPINASIGICIKSIPISEIAIQFDCVEHGNLLILFFAVTRCFIRSVVTHAALKPISRAQHDIMHLL